MRLPRLLVELLPLLALAILVGRAVRRMKQKSLRFQFFISDILAATFCLIPAIGYVTNSIVHPGDLHSVYLALLVVPCEVLGILYFRLSYILAGETQGSWQSVVWGSAFGLGLAAAAYLLAQIDGILLLFFGQFVPSILLLMFFFYCLYKVQRLRLPIQFFAIDIVSAIIGMTPGAYLVFRIFRCDAPNTDIVLLAWLVAPLQLLGMCSAKIQHILRDPGRPAPVYILAGSALGCVAAFITVLINWQFEHIWNFPFVGWQMVH
jgi:uncharacterized membrane protein (UPF0136 family)